MMELALLMFLCVVLGAALMLVAIARWGGLW